MTVILNDPNDQVSTRHEELELVLCIACTEDIAEKYRHIWHNLSHIPILAKNTTLADKCDRCHGRLLDTEF